MGLLSSVFSIFSSSGKAVDTVSDVVTKSTEGIIKGLDNMKFTDQERAAIAKDIYEKYMAMWIELQKTMANEGTATALSRRILAFMIMGVFLALIIFACAIWHHDPKWAEFVTAEGVGRLEFLAGGVGLTYFVYYGVTKFFQAKQG